MAKGEVRFRLVLDSKDFTNGIKAAKNEANAMAQDLSSRLGKAGSVLSSMGPAGLAAAAGVGALTAAAGAAVKATIDAVSAAAKYADTLAALQDKTGLSSKALQDLEVAAKLGNTSLEAIAGAVNKMQVALVNGDKNFAKLGLSIRELKQMAPEQQFKAVSEAIVNLGTAAERTAASKAILGRSGVELMGAMKAAASGATELGGALSEDALKAAADLQDQFDLLDTAWERVKLQFGAAIAQSPELKNVLNDITAALVKMAETIAKLTPQIVNFLSVVARQAEFAGSIFKAGAQFVTGNAIGAVKTFQSGQASFDMPFFNDVSSGASTTAKLPTPKTFTGKADDKAVEDAAKRADQIKQLLTKVRVEQAEQWKKWQDDALKGSLKFLEDLREGMEDFREQEAADIDSMIEMEDKRGEMIANRRKIEREEFLGLLDSIREVGMATVNMGDLIGGAFGKMLQGVGALVDGFGSVLQNIDRIKHAGGGLGGLLGKIGGGIGIASAAIGVVGFVKGLFGGKSKEEKAAEEAARKQKITETVDKLADALERINKIKMDALERGVGGLAAMFSHLSEKAGLTAPEMDRVNARMVKYKEKLKEAGLEEDEYNKKVKQRRQELEHAIGGEDLDQMKVRFERLGIVGAAMFAELKKQGLSTVEALQRMGPALDDALKSAKDHGIEIGGAFGALAGFKAKVDANQGLVAAAEGHGAAMEALKVTGGLTPETLTAMRAELGDLYGELTEKGFSAGEASALMARSLLQLRDAAREGKVELTEQEKAMIAVAESSGAFEGIKDPMEELVEVQKMMLELWAAIAHMQGVTLPDSLRKYLDEINNTKNAIGSMPTPGGPGFQNKYGGEDVDFPEGSGEPGHAASGLHTILGSGPMSGGGTPLVGHPGEEVYIGKPRGGFAMPPIVLRVDGKTWARHNNQNIRRNRYGTSSEARRFS